MEKQYYDKTIDFQHECEKYPLNVKRLEQLLDAGVDINSVSNDPDEPKSILANLIEEYSFNLWGGGGAIIIVLCTVERLCTN